MCFPFLTNVLDYFVGGVCRTKTVRADFLLMFRLLKLFLFLGFIATVGTLFSAMHLTVGDLFASIVAFMPTGWALLQVPN